MKKKTTIKKRKLSKPRNPVAMSPLLRKGHAHTSKTKDASRARQKEEARRAIEQTEQQ
jgi:hypothetical protein